MCAVHPDIPRREYNFGIFDLIVSPEISTFAFAVRDYGRRIGIL
jgi:hypothetical protein